MSNGFRLPANNAISRGQIAYERDVAIKPHYHDKTPRKTWQQLGGLEQSTWERNPTPKHKI